DLRGQHQAFVDDGATGAGRNVEGFLVLNVRGRNFIFSAPAYVVEQALESLFVEALRAAEEELLDVRLGAARFAADGIAVDWRVTPAENLTALLLSDALKNAFALQAVMF